MKGKEDIYEENEILRNSLEDAEIELNSRENECRSFQNQLTEVEARTFDFESKLIEEKEKASELENALFRMEEELNLVSNRLNRESQERIALEEENFKLSSELNSKALVIQDLEISTQELKGVIDGKSRKKDERLNSLEELVARLEGRLQDMSNENNRLRMESDDLEKKNLEKLKQLEFLKQEFSFERESLTKKSQGLGEIEIELRHDNKRLGIELSEAKAEMRRLHFRMKILQANSNSITNSITEAKADQEISFLGSKYLSKTRFINSYSS